ncbi:methylenetetrahydrofolate reductase [Nisaea acidiphila]|uniref:Methylenetetrahydrofolate reductase n=1 Tax=Nisaea acidiphila TaxID=1862145 RepID=A0A9J7AR43_9PROT|nr:methylenetetrahydrofolate reductase [Nisaea acidiphila]UUX48812.1 methylenetetrahydrofolate reductase [Nisaea acidiphila]
MAAGMPDIQALMQGFSVETTPGSAAKVEHFGALLPAGTTVNVTQLPGTDLADTIAVAKRLRAEGMEPVPHIAARSLEGEDELARYLDGLVSEAAVTEVLVIGGGVDRPAGAFAETMDVLKSGRLEAAGIVKVGVAGHPEGSPDISESGLAAALKAKNDWARETGIECYIETQFCFDAGAILKWEKAIREAGNALPIHIGVPGLATLKTLLKFAQVSGIGPSMRVLTRQTRNIARLLTVQAPDRLLVGLADGIEADPDCLIRHLHFYPFGGLAKTVAWIDQVRADEFALNSKGGFETAPLAAAAAS